MTDPVDTNALRAMAAAGDYNMGPFAVAAADEVDRLRVINDEWNRQLDDAARWIDYVIKRVNTAEFETARLREELGTQERVNADLKQVADVFLGQRDRLRAELDAWEPLWRTMRDERDQARAVIEDAPHADDCDQGWALGRLAKAPCTCWKADAL